MTREEDARIVFIVCLCMLCLLGLIVAAANGIKNNARTRLATQIAQGTHEIQWSTNDFDTLEVRIVEVK